MSRHRRRLSRRQRGILKMKRKLALLFVVIVLLLMGSLYDWSISTESAASSIRREFLHSRIPKVRHFLIKGEIFMTGTELFWQPVKKYII